MTKLISGRVAKIPSANVSTDRREFIDLAETEPDLGLPSVAGWVLSSDLTGNRSWIDPVQSAGGTPYFANTSNFAETANTAVTANIANFAYVANVANTVLTLANFTTANLVEGINLYFTNARVISALSNATITGNLTVTDTIFANTFTGANGGQPVIASIGSLTLSAGDNGNIVFTSNIIANQITANNLIINGNASKITGNLTVTDTVFANTFTGANGGQPVIASIGTLTLSAGNDGNIVFASNIIANKITANNLVINDNELFSGASGANLTVTQIISNSWVGLYTANVIETGDNLYFTNARVIAALSNATITGNLTVTDTIFANTFTGANGGQPVIASIGTLTLSAGDNGNIVFTSNIIANKITANNLVINGNELFTGQQGANLIVTQITANSWVGLYTANVIETSGNLYFTNARVIAALSNATITGNLTVTDTIFANTFTGANGGQPVIASIGTLTLSAGDNGNIVFTSNIIANKITANSLVINGNEIFATEEGANLTVTQITSNSWVGLYTANVVESPANLYYTNARARTAFTAADSSIVIDWAAGTISANTGTVTGSILPFLTTANVLEASSNLYFTNARVIAALSNATITGNLTVTDTIFANTFTGANGGQPVIASIGTLTLSAGDNGNIVFTSNIVANKITANNFVINGKELFSGDQDANLTVTRITSDSWNRLYTANVIETSGNLYFTVERVNATVQPFLTAANIANFVSTVNATVQPFLTTANVIETSGNLYFTNARVVSALIAGDNISIESNGRISANVTAAINEIANISLTIDNLTTDGITEGATNLYFTVARVNATVQSFLTTANVVETAGNLYFTNARANATLWPSLTAANIANFNSTVNAIIQPSLTTANVIETSGNLYYTNARVNATVQPFLTTANVIETSGNLYFTNARVLAALVTANVFVENLIANSAIFANAIFLGAVNVTSNIISGSGATFSGDVLTGSVTANIWNRLYTANVIETSGNLYYTNARARTAFTAADSSIVIDWAAGTISANLITAVSILNATQRIQSTGVNTYTLNVPISTPESILVIVEGLVQIPAVDYTVSGTTLTLSDYPILNSNIEVRYYGTDAIYSSSSITTKVDSFIGTGANTYTLSLNPPSKDAVTVIVNGVYRQSELYSINNKILTFDVAPAIGANVDIRTVSGIAGTAFNTRTYTADGTSNAFVITDGFTKDTILVFANGFARIPTTDYTVTNNIVTLASNVLSINGQVIQIRELGVTGLVGGTTAASISGYDLTTGNLVPTIDVTKNLGSSIYKWNNSYVNQSYVTNVLILNGTTISTTGSSFTLVSGNTITTISGPTQSSRAFGLALIFGG